MSTSPSPTSPTSPTSTTAPTSATWALVTGASSGFGLDFAQALARDGHNLVLVARRTAPMQALAQRLQSEHGVRCVVLGRDLAQVGAAQQLKTELDAQGIEVEVLINNAGYGVFGEFMGQPLQRTMDMLQLNVMALTELTHVFGQAMAQRRSGRILLVASIGGYQATPTYAAYSASKAYVLLLGEALHEELRHEGVTVTVLSPGISATSFLAVSGQRATPYQRALMMSSPRVVGIGLRALKRGRASIIPGLLNSATAWFNRFVPRMVQRKMAHAVMRND